MSRSRHFPASSCSWWTNWGVKLFRRSQYRVVLTDDGMLLRRRAQEIVELADKAERELQHLDTELTGEIANG